MARTASTAAGANVNQRDLVVPPAMDGSSSTAALRRRAAVWLCRGWRASARARSVQARLLNLVGDKRFTSTKFSRPLL